MQNAQQQLRAADNLTELWRGLLPGYEAPSRTQFLTWAGMASEEVTAYAVNRAARKVQKEPMTPERIGRYITGVLTSERRRQQFQSSRT